jgi:hypothetical protein
MKWLLYALGSIAILIVLLALVGAMLPKTHTATRQIRLRQTPDAVYALITAPADWRGLQGVEQLPPANGRKRWKEIDGHNQITYELIEATPPAKMVTRIADESLPFGGTWTYMISTDGNATILRVTEDGEVRNPIFRFVSRFIMGHTATLDKYLTAVGKKFGEPITIED